MSTHASWFASAAVLALVACGGDGAACSDSSQQTAREDGSSVSVSVDDEGGSVGVKTDEGDEVEVSVGDDDEK